MRAAAGGPAWAEVAPLARGGGRQLQGQTSVPSLEPWGGPRPGELAPSAAQGLGRRWVLGREGCSEEGPGRGAGMELRGREPHARATKWSSCFAGSLKGGWELFSGKLGYLTVHLHPHLRRPNLRCPPFSEGAPCPSPGWIIGALASSPP